MDALYELKEQLCEELKEYGKKGKLDVGGLEIVDKLAHAIKNIDKIIEAYDEGEYSSRYSRNMNGSYRYSRQQGGRNRGGNSSRGYSRTYSMAADDMVMQLEEMLQNAPNEQIRMKIERLMREVEQA